MTTGDVVLESIIDHIRAGSQSPAGVDIGDTIRNIPHDYHSYNTVYLLELPPAAGLPRHLIAKRYRSDVSKHFHRTEYDALLAVYRLTEGRELDFSVPRPLYFFGDIETLVVEHVAGRPLYDLVSEECHYLSGKEARDRLLRLMSLCGRGLGQLHGLEDHDASEGLTPHAQSELFDKLKHHLYYLRDRKMLPTEAADRIVDTVTSSLASLAGVQLRLVRQHGDYSLRNILFRDDNLVFLDFNYSSTNTIHNDLSCFLVSLETLNPYPRHPLFNHRLKNSFKKEFIDSYFSVSPPLTNADATLIGLNKLRNLIIHFRERYDKYFPLSSGKRIYLHLLGTLYRKAISRETERLSLWNRDGRTSSSHPT